MIKLLSGLFILLTFTYTSAFASTWSLSFVASDSKYSPVTSITFVPTDSDTYYAQSNLDGNYQKVATATAITFSSNDPTVQIYTYAKKSDWYSLATPVTTSAIATSSGRRSFKLRKNTTGSFVLTAQATGYSPAILLVNVAFPPPPPPPPVQLPVPPPTPILPVAPIVPVQVAPSPRVEFVPTNPVEIPTTIIGEPVVSVVNIALPTELKASDKPVVLAATLSSGKPTTFDFIDQLLTWLQQVISDNIGL